MDHFVQTSVCSWTTALRQGHKLLMEGSHHGHSNKGTRKILAAQNTKLRINSTSRVVIWGIGHQRNQMALKVTQRLQALRWALLIYADPGARPSATTILTRLRLNYYMSHFAWPKNHGHYIDGLVQERRNSIANALELRLSCTNPSIYAVSLARYKTTAMKQILCWDRPRKTWR